MLLLLAVSAIRYASMTELPFTRAEQEKASGRVGGCTDKESCRAASHSLAVQMPFSTCLQWRELRGGVVTSYSTSATIWNVEID